MKKLLFLLLAASLLASCKQLPDGIEAVDHVDPAKYVGTWYEIVRLDHDFEHGLQKVSATYTKRKDGGLDVLNRGVDPKTGEWKEARGTAYFVEPPNADGTYPGTLEVSFLGPFYASYNIIALDKPYYNYVMLTGSDRSYFWILSRTPQLPYPIKAQLLAKAKELGFDTSKFIYVEQ